VYLSPFDYGVFDVVGRREENSEPEVLQKSVIVALINPSGDDRLGLKKKFKIEGEPYVADCMSGYKKVCLLTELEELKNSVGSTVVF